MVRSLEIMIIKDFIQKHIIKDESEKHFILVADSDGLNFILSPEDLGKCRNGECDSWLLHQYVHLRMLEEQGLAEEIANGFCIPSEYAAAIDDDTQYLLGFPPRFVGSFCVRVNGQTSHSSFSVQIIPVMPDGKEVYSYQLKGPCIQLSPQEMFLLNSAEWHAFQAVRVHHDLQPENRSDQNNLKLVGALQAAQKSGMAIDLSHFNKITVHEPENVGISVIEQDNGSLLLTPSFGTGTDPEYIYRRLGQLKGAQDTGVIRIQDQIIVLDEKRLKATHEILSNRVIPKAQVRRFLESPTAFLDASLVDLDAGFSLRVRGATVFRHAYFGESDGSGISWFERTLPKTISVCPPHVLNKIVENQEDLLSVKKQINDARNTGATVVEVAGRAIDISDWKSTENTIRSIENKLSVSPDTPIERSVEKGGIKQEEGSTVVVDVIENDDVQEYGTDYIPALIREATYKNPIDYSTYKRKPFPHQDEGVRWLLGLAEPSLSLAEGEESLNGALLADDMGLGKTYMALIAIAEYYRQCRERNIVERPILIVVPLTLLENWKEEIEKTFQVNPFTDVVILQSDAHLNKYRIEGSGIEIKQKASMDLLEKDNPSKIPKDAIRYSLKIGKDFKPDNLDIPRRAVLTTYQTLRDYQFSLCRVDWSFVVFDEAQNIKNPNTLATRAAKGLKAKFKLIATGTPVENHLGDFWCLMDTARPGTLGAYQDFRQEYITPIRKSSSDQVSQLRNIIGKNLRNKVGALMLRRLKEDNLPGLPRKYIYSGISTANMNGCIYEPLLEREMHGEQLQRYNTTVDTVLELQQQGEVANPMLSGLHQLREISLHPLLLNSGVITSPKTAKEALELMQLSGKLQILLDILDQIKGREEKAIIFLINKRLQSFLKIALGIIYNTTVEIINGDTKAISKSKKTADKTRKGIIDTFQAKAGFGVIIMSPIAAGTGLTVTAANNVIHLERHWNPAKEDQATDRVFRIGQEKNVNIYLPILKHPSIDSFDVNLHVLLSNKVTLKDAVVTPEEVTNEEMGRANFRSTGKQEDQERPLRGNDLSLLSWQEFEALCAELYSKYLNCDVFLTPSNDLGADVVVMGKENTLIQCKHTSNHTYDSLEPLIQIHSAKPAYEEKTGKVFSSLIVAINAKKFSRKVLKAKRTYNVKLVGLRDLDDLLKQYIVTRKQIQKRLLAPRIFEKK